MTRVLKERTFSGTTNPEAASWENEHRQIEEKQQMRELFF